MCDGFVAEKHESRDEYDQRCAIHCVVFLLVAIKIGKRKRVVVSRAETSHQTKEQLDRFVVFACAVQDDEGLAHIRRMMTEGKHSSEFEEERKNTMNAVLGVID